MTRTMKGAVPAMLWALGASCGGCHAAIPAGAGHDGCFVTDARANVVRSVSQFADAFRRGDVASVDALLHEGYVHTNSGNKPTSRADWMKWFTSRSRKMETGELAVLQYEMSELDVATFSGVAIVTGRVDATTRTSGATESSRIRFTNVWLCSAGQWKRVAFHDAPATDAR